MEVGTSSNMMKVIFKQNYYHLLWKAKKKKSNHIASYNEEIIRNHTNYKMQHEDITIEKNF